MKAQAERKRKRCAEEISRCDEHRRVLVQRMQAIDERKRKMRKIDRMWQNIEDLEKRGEAVWKLLEQKNKWKKPVVLAVFASRKIPREMTEGCWRQNAPEEIGDDRDILLARLDQKAFSTHYYSSQTVFSLPNSVMKDLEVVAKATSCYPEVLQQEGFPAKVFDAETVFLAFINSERLKTALDERWRGVGDSRRDAATCIRNIVGKFSERIRGNANLMLKAAEQKANVFDHISKSLENNWIFAVRLADCAQEVPEDALGLFGERVQGNRQVVLAFVRRNGMCLKDATMPQRGDNEIVRAACENKADALAFCAPGRTKQMLGRDKTFMLDIFSRLRCSDSALWKMLSQTLKADPDLVVAAHQSSCMSVDDLPRECEKDRKFWIELIKRDSFLWYRLPSDFQNDPEMAQSIKSFGSQSLVHDVIDRFSFLASNHDLWTAVTDSNLYNDAEADEEYGCLRNVIQNYAPELIRNDKHLMSRACKNDAAVLTCLPWRLQQDRDCVQAAVEGETYYELGWMPHQSQGLFPDLVAKAISIIAADIDYEEGLDGLEIQ